MLITSVAYYLDLNGQVCKYLPHLVKIYLILQKPHLWLVMDKPEALLRAALREKLNNKHKLHVLMC